MKRGEHSGSIQWQPSTIVLLMRFVIWPAISISVIYALATRTNLLPPDPVLVFTLMLMPAGPPATSISSLTDLNESKPEDKMAVSKFLIVSSPPTERWRDPEPADSHLGRVHCLPSTVFRCGWESESERGRIGQPMNTS